MTPKLKYAREIVKDMLIREGIKPSWVTSHNITKGARALLRHFPTWRELREERRRLK